MKKPKELDPIEQLIEVSDKCMTFVHHVKKDGTLTEHPCNCRANVKRILKKYWGIKA